MRLPRIELVLAAYLSGILLLYRPITLLHIMPIDSDLPRSLHPLLLLHPSHIAPTLHPTHKDLTHKLQPGHKHAKHTRDDEMADTGPDIQPTALVPDEPEKVHRQHVADGHDQHDEAARRDAEPPVEDTQVGADDGEGDDEFEDEEEALGEGVEDRDEAVDGVEGEGGEGGDVAGGEEGGLEEVEEEEGDAGVGEGEGAVWGRGRVGGLAGR